MLWKRLGTQRLLGPKTIGMCRWARAGKLADDDIQESTTSLPPAYIENISDASVVWPQEKWELAKLAKLESRQLGASIVARGGGRFPTLDSPKWDR